MDVLRPRALLWPAGAVLGVVAEGVAFDFADPLRWIPDLLVGWTFIGCGLTAAARRPESRIGILLAVTGFTWYLGNFATLGLPVVAWMSAHALYVHPDLGGPDPTWCCEHAGIEVAPVGGL